MHSVLTTKPLERKIRPHSSNELPGCAVAVQVCGRRRRSTGRRAISAGHTTIRTNGNYCRPCNA